jgi:hypothetical protein
MLLKAWLSKLGCFKQAKRTAQHGRPSLLRHSSRYARKKVMTALTPEVSEYCAQTRRFIAFLRFFATFCRPKGCNECVEPTEIRR